MEGTKNANGITGLRPVAIPATIFAFLLISNLSTQRATADTVALRNTPTLKRSEEMSVGYSIRFPKSCKVKEGDRFGRLVVIGQPFSMKRDSGRQAHAVCQCDCGTIVVAQCTRLVSTHRNPCKCQSKSIKHRLHNHPLYRRWVGMVQRCEVPTQVGYHRYGGRGIRVCELWRKAPEAFIRWGLEHGWQPDLHIDRIDNDKGYSPDNCRWVTKKFNCRNREGKVLLTAFGETKSAPEWAEDSRARCSYQTMLRRVRKCDWPHEDAICTPSRQQGQQECL